MAFTIEAKTREGLGKAVGSLRRQGILPAVVYGAKIKAQSISVSMKDFLKALKEAGESTLLTLKLDGKDLNVLIHDVARDAVRDTPLHADFLAVEMDKEVHTKVELEFVGESPAVKTEGGILVKVMHEIELSALPKDLPHGIQVDISKLAAIGDKLFVSDLNVPNVRFLVESDEVVALIEAPRSEEELKALETEPTATVEVMTEAEAKKKAEEEAKAAAGEPAAE